MVEYSIELYRNFAKINRACFENDNLCFLQNIMKFFAEGIEYIDEQYLIVSKEYIKNIINEAKKIWETGSADEKLKKLNIEYTKKLNEIKPFKNILKNKEEKAAMDCILTVLSNPFDNAKEWVAYDFIFIESYLSDMETLNINENKIKILFEKYFKETGLT